jgi:YidC/Oxa1 family membrane protein insertase
LNMEKRLLLAFVLSAAILLGWSVLFPPPQRQESPLQKAPAAATQPVPVAKDEQQPEEASPIPPPAQDDGVASEEIPDATQATAEEVRRLSNDVIAVEVTNRGAAISSYRLLAYEGDEGQPLELVQDVAFPGRTLPLQMLGDEGPDQELYSVEESEGSLVYLWSDGRGNSVRKTIRLSGKGYGLDIEIVATGGRRDDLVSVGTGMRNPGEIERNSRLALWGEGVLLADGEVERLKRKKVKSVIVEAPANLQYVGFEDAYFFSLLRPDGGVSEIQIEPFEYSLGGGEKESNRILRISVVPRGGELRGQLLGAPKEYNLLQNIDQGVEKTLNFGIFAPISILFLKVLHWIYSVVGNYGVAIILLTLGIRILLFPLMHTSTVSMRKMQKVQPKVKEIQARYKKKKSDPEARAKMNQEMMALYKQEGVNPMAGCLPMLVQLPILWALYRLFLTAIELRHAPFMLWITDLSAKDPYYVTPILMTATMWLQQRLAPQAGDPQQQKIMRMMPLIFGIMFLQFPSGLVLYWLTNNVITIIQQEVTLHLVGERRLRGGSAKGRKDAKK